MVSPPPNDISSDLSLSFQEHKKESPGLIVANLKTLIFLTLLILKPFVDIPSHKTHPSTPSAPHSFPLSGFPPTQDIHPVCSPDCETLVDYDKREIPLLRYIKPFIFL
jgi:hypothetical protein